MLVVSTVMWPGGSPKGAYPLALATLGCIGRAKEDNPQEGILKNERMYVTTLYRDATFNGPSFPVQTDPNLLTTLKAGQSWRVGEEDALTIQRALTSP